MHELEVCLQEYYTSGFLSIQAAIDAYALGLGLPATMDTSLAPIPGGNGTTNAALDAGAISSGRSGPGNPGAVDIAAWTQWGAVMPTSAYTHNDFYVRPPPLLFFKRYAGRAEIQELWMSGELVPVSPSMILFAHERGIVEFLLLIPSLCVETSLTAKPCCVAYGDTDMNMDMEI